MRTRLGNESLVAVNINTAPHRGRSAPWCLKAANPTKVL